jgi:hypothetical protein
LILKTQLLIRGIEADKKADIGKTALELGNHVIVVGIFCCLEWEELVEGVL